MLEIRSEFDGETATLTLTGEADIRQARALRDALLACAARAKRLRLACEGVTACDISFLQILESAHRYFQREHRTLECVNHRLSAAVRQAVERSGFFRRAQCPGSTTACPFHQPSAA
ncbi:MAG: STAS domain-containing protein [Spirochaetes bacterium]|nr:STAS domain-containing protein [Spirochaetota bacterium]